MVTALLVILLVASSILTGVTFVFGITERDGAGSNDGMKWFLICLACTILAGAVLAAHLRGG